MDLLQKFIAFVQKENLFQKRDHLLLAVSGGADSAVLCALCAAAGYRFGIAHANFQLRAAESYRDEAFVKALAQKYAVPFYHKTFDTAEISKLQKTGIEETARKLRYDWFSELMNNDTGLVDKYMWLLTAHHADDNIETVLMNFARGTGVKGMRGIVPKQGNIVRPLLFAAREEIESYANQQYIDFVTDSSNAESNYTRNFFRNKVIPAIETIYPKLKENVLDNISRFADIEQLYEDAIDKLKARLIETKGEERHIPVLKLAKSKPLHTIIYEVIRHYGFTAARVSEAEKLLSAESGKYILSPTHRILKNRGWLIIAPLKTSDDTVLYLIEKDTETVLFPGGTLQIDPESSAGEISIDPSVAQLDAASITYPLLLRRPKPGDYFYPLGMQKKKKLSRFFADIKLSLLQKEQVWVLESGKKILWVAGYRIDDRFKITAHTKSKIRFRISKDGRKGSGAEALQ